MYDDLLFYSAYEDFYRMAATSSAFAAYCRDAFGEDFSQDGFSDLRQIQQVLPHIPQGDSVHILDIGCGNGKMLGYLQKQTGAFIHGFDYSRQAIQTAKCLFPEHSDFQVGLIGEMDYPADSFDVVISMDTLYFAPDMTELLAQIKCWLKPGGVFFAGYQEGDVIPKTGGWEESQLARALQANTMVAEHTDITYQTWQLLRKKRQSAEKHSASFLAEKQEKWYQLLMAQTECAVSDYQFFSENFGRYLVVAQKKP